MIDYFSRLDEEEKKTVISLLPGKAYRILFQQESEKFAKIKPGFRPNAISDDDAVTLAIKHYKNPFIASYANFTIDNWLQEIQENINLLESDGCDNDKALAQTLPDSYFCDNIELYFKLTGKEIEEGYIEKLNRMIKENQELIGKEKSLKLSEGGIITSNEVEILQNQLNERDKQLKDLEDIYKSQLQSVQDEFEKTKEALINAKQQIQVLQNERQKTEIELSSLQARVRHDDSKNAIAVTTVENYDYCSLCEVVVDLSGKPSLIRLADIGRNGILDAFYVDEDKPKTFGNRPRLYYKQGPTEPGTIGVWNWTAIPNNADPSRDYIISDFNADVNPIEIITIKNCDTEAELLERIKSGINIEPTTPRILFSVYLNKGQGIGYLCWSRDFQQNGTIIKLSDTVMSLPRYEFSFKNSIRLSNGKVFYRSVSIGIPSESIKIRNSFDIVKKVIFDRNSWQIFKQKGRTRSEWKNMRELLGEMDSSAVIDDIVKEADCSHKEAQKMLDEFVKNVNEYIDGNSIEDTVIEAVITTNSVLMDRCKDLIMQDWIEENKTAVEDADKTIEDLKKQIENSRKELERELSERNIIISKQKEEAERELISIRTEYDSLQASLQKLNNTIAAKEKLATDVEDAVEKRIRQAQNDAAEFIASFAFAPQAVVKQTETVVDTKTANYTNGESLNPEELENNTSWKETIETISYELGDAGVITKYSLPLAAYMYAAYLNHCPLIIIGPNADAIVDAFSGAVFGKTAGILDCIDHYRSEVVKECYSSSDRVVKIINPFSNEWISRLPEITGNHNKYFIAVHPYSEDILIGPKSFYNFMLPIFTEMFIEKVPTGKIIGGTYAINYKEYKNVETSKNHEKLLVEMRTPLLARNRIQTLLSNMHVMVDNPNSDYDVLFALLPYAYATMQMPLLLGIINGEEKKKLSISKALQDMINGMYGSNE